MAKWMGIEVPFWLLFAIGLGLVLLVSLQVEYIKWVIRLSGVFEVREDALALAVATALD